jgi:PIN domain nuclease of toxin-antitoxin system
MRLLLDTHTLVWAAVETRRLSRRARDLIADPENDRFVSAASAYEIEYKRDRDLSLARLPQNLDELSDRLVFDWLPIEYDHAVQAGRLPRHHGDPWDRVIVAQALADDLTFISADDTLLAYGARIVW